MLAEVLAKIATDSVKFAVFTYTAKETGETARFSVMLGASLTSLYQQDIAVLEATVAGLTGVAKIAGEELLASRRESLEKGIGNNSQYVHAPQNADTYVHIPGMPGCKVHGSTGEMYVTGIISSKTVLTAGIYKTVKSSEKTIAKNQIKKSLGSSKFRQFSLNNLSSVTVDGDTVHLN
jgi:hypothetical protein